MRVLSKESTVTFLGLAWITMRKVMATKTTMVHEWDAETLKARDKEKDTPSMDGDLDPVE